MFVSTIHARAADALRSRVAGPDAERARARIWDTPGERWFTESDPIWRVHADASMFVGGIAALLLQSLHPLAMVGVAEHSGYRGDPWGRLQRTSHFIATTTFGTTGHATQMIDAVRAVHERVVGQFDGAPYAASDPELLTWVNAAEAFSFLAAYQAYGSGRLTTDDQDVYVAQAAGTAERLGAHDVPRTVDGLQGTLERFRPELRATEACRDAMTFLIDEPPLPRPARPGYAMLVRGAIEILPAWAREELALKSRRSDRLCGQAGASGIRWAMS